MGDVWDRLQSVTIRISADKSPRKTDRVTAEKLNEDRTVGNWKRFYDGINALERGCGYSDYSDLIKLCKTAGEQDDKRLLQVIEQKHKLFDVVLILRSVEPAIKLSWINSRSFTNVHTLFECLRQALADTEQPCAEVDVIVNGLLDLQKESSEHFQYLLDRHILYKNGITPIVSQLLEHLPKEGWAVLSQCISFDTVHPDQIRFWDQCTRRLNWANVHIQAEPLLDAWEKYIVQSLSGLGYYRRSLYCDASNMLITVLCYKLDTIEQYSDAMERILRAGETAMYRWYESGTHQFGTLASFLSVIAHLYYIWLNNSVAYGKPFPEKLRLRCLSLINQWRYLWDGYRKDPIGEEIVQLESWLKATGK